MTEPALSTPRSAEPRREGDAPPARLTDAVHPRVTKILEASSELRNHPQLRDLLPNGLCWRIEEQALRLNGCLVEQRKVIAEQHQTFVNDQAQIAMLEEQLELRGAGRERRRSETLEDRGCADLGERSR